MNQPPQLHRPAARIRANGNDITSLLLGNGAGDAILVSLTITDEAGIKSDWLEIVLDNSRGFATPPLGSEIEVALGYEPAPQAMGRFKLDSFTREGPPSKLTLVASAVELTADFKARRMRSWHETTIGEIVKSIAGRHGLGVSMDAGLAARAIPHIDQQAESDMAFLTRLAGRNDAVFKVDDGKVVFAPRGSLDRPSGAPKGIITVRPADVSSWSVTHSERGGHKSAVAYWQDHDKRKRVAAVVGEGRPRHVDNRLYASPAEAKAAAQGALDRLTRGRREGQFNGPGNPAITAEAAIRLQDFDPECEGLFFAKTVMHTFSASGYTTAVTLESEKGGDSD